MDGQHPRPRRIDLRVERDGLHRQRRDTPEGARSPALYEFFGLDTKECYRSTPPSNCEKNPKLHYFIDKMQKKLNEKIRRDEELERMRR